MDGRLKRTAVGVVLVGIGVLIGNWARASFESEAAAQVSRIKAGGGRGSVSSADTSVSFPMTVYKGPNRTVKYFSAGRECTALNVAEVLVYPGLMVFKDNRDVIGGTGLPALGQFSIIVGQ